MSSIKKEGTKKALKKHECYQCGRWIPKGEEYAFRELRYNNRIITLCFCYSKECAPIYLINKNSHVKEKEAQKES